MLREWLAETHPSGFELRRHFFLRFFDSELIADPSEAKVVAGGAFGVLVSLSLIFCPAYYHKYRVLMELGSPEPYRRAVLGDVLFLITLVMSIAALLTVLEWAELFPGPRDYLALAALPVKMRDIFTAKFTALFTLAFVVIVGAALVPSLMLPAIMLGRYGMDALWHVLGLFLGSLLGGCFVFFTLVAMQGALLNLIPIRQFARVSLAVQGLLLAALLGGLPFVFSIPDVHNRADDLSGGWSYAPPFWFFGIDQIVLGNRDALPLARAAIVALLVSAAVAVLGYWWSYWRHRVRVLESPAAGSAESRTYWPDVFSEYLMPIDRTLGVFAFIGKSLGRSRQHRLILMTCAGIAIYFISEGSAGIVFSNSAISLSTNAVREAAIAIPLAFSLLLLAGFRYLFRLPVEFRANWVFRITEPGHANEMLAGVELFFFIWGAAPIAIFTILTEVILLGASMGLIVTIDCLLISLILIEVLLFSFERIPFTSSYVPGQRPLLESLLKCSVIASVYIWGLASLENLCLRTRVGQIILIATLGIAWWQLRRARLKSGRTRRITFSEEADPAVQLLGIDRD